MDIILKSLSYAILSYYASIVVANTYRLFYVFTW